MLPRSRSAPGRWVGWLVAAAATAFPAPAGEPPTVHLGAGFDPDGAARVSAWSDTVELAPDRLVDAVRATFGCAVPEPAALTAAGVDCPGAARRSGGRISAELVLDAWRQPLEELGAEELALWLGLPDAPGLDLAMPPRARLERSRWGTVVRLPVDALPAGSLSFTVGPTPRWWLGYATVAGGVLAGLLFLSTLARSWARRRAEVDPAAAFFFGFLPIQAAAVSLVVVWLALPGLGAFPGALRMAWPTLDRPEAIATTAGVHLVLAFLSTLALWLPARPILWEVRGLERASTRRAIALCAAASAAGFLPIAAGATALLVFPEDRGLALAAAAVGLGGLLVGAGGLAALLGFAPQTVEEGELHEALVELAEATDVRLRRLQLLSGERTRIGWASTGGGSFLLSRFLVRSLPRDELRAILAHEMAHAEGRDGLRLFGALVAAAVVGAVSGVAATTALGMWKAPDPWTFWATFGVAVPVTIPLAMAVFRRRELRADARGAELCGSPVVMARSLRNITRLNGLPLQWSRGVELFLTHPSTARRIRRLVGAEGVPDETGETPPDPYPLPDPPTAQPRALGPEAPRPAAFAASALALFLTLTLPVLFLALVPVAELSVPWLMMVTALGTGATAVVSLVPSWWAGRARLDADWRRAAAKLCSAGIDPDRGGWRPVTVQPGGELRVAGGSLTYDAGYLASDRGRRVFVGSRSGFAIPSEAAAADLGPTSPGWLGHRSVRLVWPEGSALLWADARRIIPRRGAAERLLADLGEPDDDVGADLGALGELDWPDPPPGEPLETIRARQRTAAIPTLLVVGTLAAAAAWIGDLGGREVGAAVVMATGAVALHLAPEVMAPVETDRRPPATPPMAQENGSEGSRTE